MTLLTPEPNPSPIIFDNTVLSNFALVQQFDILRRLYEGRAFICRAVQKEIESGIQSGWQDPQHRNRTRLEAINLAIKAGWLQFPNDRVDPTEEVIELRLAIEYGQRFGAGEAESMAIARTRNWVFASDDMRARRFAEERGIRVTGTLGILIKTTQKGILKLSQADSLHACMIDEGYRSPLSYEKGISTFLQQLNQRDN